MSEGVELKMSNGQRGIYVFGESVIYDMYCAFIALGSQMSVSLTQV